MPATILVIGSVVVLLVILHDAFEVMLLPRRVKSRLRIVRMFFRFTGLIWFKLARRIGSEDRRYNYLSLYGPPSMVQFRSSLSPFVPVNWQYRELHGH